jgi:hypothetical protein
MTFDNELSARSKLNEGGRIDVSAHSYKASILDNSSVFLTMWEDVGSIGENGVGYPLLVGGFLGFPLIIRGLSVRVLNWERCHVTCTQEHTINHTCCYIVPWYNTSSNTS